MEVFSFYYLRPIRK